MKEIFFMCMYILSKLHKPITPTVYISHTETPHPTSLAVASDRREVAGSAALAALGQVLLVVVLRWVPGGCGQQLRHDAFRVLLLLGLDRAGNDQNMA